MKEDVIKHLTFLWIMDGASDCLVCNEHSVRICNFFPPIDSKMMKGYVPIRADIRCNAIGNILN